MSLGPIMFDLQGPELLAEERDLLQHPLAGGIILFDRNYRTPEQLTRLVADIRACQESPLLVSVDHEGGNVQRFRDPFTNLPVAARFGEIHDRDPVMACGLAERYGWIMAVELRAHNVDFSFAPVLDLGKGQSKVIGRRAFHGDPEVVAKLAKSFLRGVRRAGMAAVGKHFPGHGTVEADSHVDTPVDERTLDNIWSEDLIPFRQIIHAGLPAIMPAHVIYPEIDDKPAGFSSVWLRSVLRERLGFQGAIFSDDITMAGANIASKASDRAQAALDAGCDMVLVCNDRQGVQDILNELGEHHDVDQAGRATRLAQMHGHGQCHWDDLLSWENYRQAVSALSALEPDRTHDRESA
uniref:Beta-hexosaminidase n=1 Tax=Candidatus Kentrum sp. MB TaxID=2138164 RepID=A0A450XVD8_9GAMM|nr:MAG: beta-N-acetylhexosaminidase [Candidatus Kentron sp. MB]VFK76108.1 MAG: beta-N-acetylhexosaminidase [Candidatus Kentron sp. MB]